MHLPTNNLQFICILFFRLAILFFSLDVLIGLWSIYDLVYIANCICIIIIVCFHNCILFSFDLVTTANKQIHQLIGGTFTALKDNL